MAGSTEIWHADLSASLRSGTMLVFDSKNMVLSMSTGVSACANDWLTFGVGRMVSKPCSPVLGLAGWASCPTSTLPSCDFGSSRSLTCASLPVLSFQPVQLPEGNKKNFPY